MNGLASLISYPRFSIHDNIVEESPAPYIAKISYKDGSIISIEEYERSTKSCVEIHDYVIKKDRFFFPQVIYKGSSDGSNWEMFSSLPFDQTTKQPASTTLLYFFRYMLCIYFKIDVITPVDNPNFEEFYDCVYKTDIPNVQNVSYLKILPADFSPGPFLSVTAAAALICKSSSEFIELFPLITKKAQQLKSKYEVTDLREMFGF